MNITNEVGFLSKFGKDNNIDTNLISKFLDKNKSFRNVFKRECEPRGIANKFGWSLVVYLLTIMCLIVSIPVSIYFTHYKAWYLALVYLGIVFMYANYLDYDKVERDCEMKLRDVFYPLALFTGSIKIMVMIILAHFIYIKFLSKKLKLKIKL